MCLTAKNFALQEENINISKLQGKTTHWENWMRYQRKMDRKRERGREGAMVYEKGG